jgi:threonine dehydratase
VHDALPGDAGLWLKLECLQVGGSFKTRGAFNKVGLLDAAARARGLVTASGGNHGIAVAYAAANAGLPAVIHLPEGATPLKRAAIRRLGAELVIGGRTWDEANEAALATAAARGLTYVHPFGDPDIIAGQGTVAVEVLDALPRAETLVVAIGGGGLIGGIATLAKSVAPAIRIIGVEPEGAPTLRRSLDAGAPVTLEAITTRAGTLAPRRSTVLNLDIVSRTVDDIVLVSDAEMHAAAGWLWREMGLAVELAGAAALAALATRRYLPHSGEAVVAIVCGAGTDGLDYE